MLLTGAIPFTTTRGTSMPSQPLDTSAKVTLNGSGNGTARIGPKVGQHWTLGNIAVSVSSNTLEPTCKIYLRAIDPGNFVDGTFSGSQDSTDSANGLRLGPGQEVIAVWSGGDANATATVSIYGTVDN